MEWPKQMIFPLALLLLAATCLREEAAQQDAGARTAEFRVTGDIEGTFTFNLRAEAEALGLGYTFDPSTRRVWVRMEDDDFNEFVVRGAAPEEGPVVTSQDLMVILKFDPFVFRSREGECTVTFEDLEEDLVAGTIGCRDLRGTRPAEEKKTIDLEGSFRLSPVRSP